MNDHHGQTHRVYFDPQRISGFRNQDAVPHVFPDYQQLWVDDGSADIRFDTLTYPAFYPILRLSEMFPAHTLQLKWWLQSEGANRSMVVFRGGEASHVYEIPDHNSNTGRTATLFEVFCSHINCFQDSEELDLCIDTALEVVKRVKVKRLAEPETTIDEGDRAEKSSDSAIVYNVDLDEEVKALMKPLLYSLDLIPADEERIAKLVADLRSTEDPAKRIEFLKEITCLDLDFIVPERGRPIRFALFPCDLFGRINLDQNIAIVVPIVRYINADETTGKYSKNPDGNFPDVEWEIRYLYLTREDLRQIRKLPDDNQAPSDIDIVMTWSPRAITMKHGGPDGPAYVFCRVNNHARWKNNPNVVGKVEEAIKNVHPNREAKIMALVVDHDFLTKVLP
jgi:hypothetical protein